MRCCKIGCCERLVTVAALDGPPVATLLVCQNVVEWHAQMTMLARHDAAGAGLRMHAELGKGQRSLAVAARDGPLAAGLLVRRKRTGRPLG
jgi:hypothetical protein